jgi:alkyl hydroperoxide reductase subunit AhpC
MQGAHCPGQGVGEIPSTPGESDKREEHHMALQIASTAPDFEQISTEGTIRFHDWIGSSWCILFSHPKDFTPVCTTELGAMAKLKPDFDQRNCKVIGLSIDSVGDHTAWKADIASATGSTPGYPIIADADLKVAKLYGMLPAQLSGEAKGRTAQDNATVRTVFIIGPDKMIKAMLVYPMSTGRNFHEVLRLLDSLQLTAKHKVATPANWQAGEDVIILPSITDDEARKAFPSWNAPVPYLRYVAQPRSQ